MDLPFVNGLYVHSKVPALSPLPLLVGVSIGVSRLAMYTVKFGGVLIPCCAPSTAYLLPLSLFPLSAPPPPPPSPFDNGWNR